MEILNNIDVLITDLLNSLGFIGPILGCLFIVVESILPILPLSVFITLNFYAFGNLVGFIISYACTLVGCYLSYELIRHNFKKPFEKYIESKEHKKIEKFIKIFNKIKLENLVILSSVPFTPAFLINIAAGLSNMSKKKFLVSIIISKLFLVYFWGYVGVTLLDSLKNPIYLLRIGIITLIAYIISKLINRKTGVE